MHLVRAQRDPGQPEPTPEQLTALHRRMGPPDNEVPGTIPFHAVLGRTDELAVAIVAAQAFSSGISIKIAVRFRKSDTSGPGFGADMFGHRGHGATDGGLLIGVGYPDGRTASNVSSQRIPEPFTPEDEPLLISGGGGGGGRTFDMEYWLTPLPPPGDVTIVVAWPARGVDESHTVLPAQAIAQGVADVVELWPWQGPEEHDEPPEIPEPTLPEGGWFAQHITQRRPAGES